jgi:predicted amino acid dehydrogenase
MKFATIGHLDNEKFLLDQISKDWIHKDLIVSPEFNFKGTKGHFIAIKLTSKQLMEQPRNKTQESILNAALFAQDNLGVELIQLGALTTSVTSGGLWLTEQSQYNGFVNHGDSYTAAVTCQSVEKILNILQKETSELVLAIIGAYGVIGEAVSKILVPKFKHSILIGRREKKLRELAVDLKGSFETTIDIKTKEADIIITATSHPTALLNSEHLKGNAIIVDVSQPPNLSQEVCQNRPDIIRIDGGYVDFPAEHHIPIPGIPRGKLFACIVEVIMQAMENERKNHVGSIDLKHLHGTEKWAEKYGFTLNELTNFGKTIVLGGRGFDQ